jgi:hypothetical protein
MLYRISFFELLTSDGLFFELRNTFSFIVYTNIHAAVFCICIKFP